MAMNLGSDGEREPEVMMDINTTPLIDVMLVLIIMLIITIPVQLHAVNLNLPQGKALPPQQPAVVVTVKINVDGSVLWNDLVVSDQATLEAQLRQAATEANPPEVQLRPEGAAPYGVVARVLAAAQRLGVTKIGMVGNERFGS
jgi:biopolymer transport protein ExbD